MTVQSNYIICHLQYNCLLYSYIIRILQTTCLIIVATETVYICFSEMKKMSSITKTYRYNFDPLKPHFYIVKLGFTGVCIIFLISAQKHRLWVLVRTATARRF